MVAVKTTEHGGGYVAAQSMSNLQLGEGRYSLSSRCAVPYVEFIGSANFQKTISWGETVEVPCQEMVTVRNASYHGGQIFINGGVDPYPMPLRITVPCEILPADGEFGIPRTTNVDTRRARRAYFAINMDLEEASIARVYGVTVTSLDTFNMIATSPLTPGSGFVQEHAITGAYPLIPLGYQAPLGDDSRPHALLDYGYVLLLAEVQAARTAMFILEY